MPSKLREQLRGPKGRKSLSGFTLAEVVIAVVLLALVVEGLIYGYISVNRRAQWAGHSLAAQSLASQSVEQARAARWFPQSWPIVDDLPPTSFVQVNTLDIPTSGQPVLATNYVSITQVSTTPALRQIRADCVWRFYDRGLFTNTVVTLRAPDQ